MRNNKNGSGTLLLSLFLMAGCTTGEGFEGCLVPPGRTSHVDVQRSFAAYYPEYGFKSYKETPIPGLFEIDTDENILYYYPATGHLLTGGLYAPDQPTSPDRNVKHYGGASS